MYNWFSGDRGSFLSRVLKFISLFLSTYPAAVKLNTILIGFWVKYHSFSVNNKYSKNCVLCGTNYDYKCHYPYSYKIPMPASSRHYVSDLSLTGQLSPNCLAHPCRLHRFKHLSPWNEIFKVLVIIAIFAIDFWSK